MTLLLFSLIILLVAYCAGLLGSLTGLGGGIIITPVLVLFFHVDIHYAMGASLLSVIVTSSGAAIAYLKEGYTNIRVGMLLEVTAVIGALFGAMLLTKLSVSYLAIVFGAALIFSGFFSIRRRKEHNTTLPSHPWALALKLESTQPTQQGLSTYPVYRVPLALGLMGIAGMLSSLLGIGSGALKVMAMDQAMGLPFRVSTATSNFIIGITATLSAGVYLLLGYIDPVLTFPVIIGVLVGATTGAKLLNKINTGVLRRIFAIAVLCIAVQMIYKGLSGGL